MTGQERVDLAEMNRTLGELVGTVKGLVDNAAEDRKTRAAMAADIKLLTTQMDRSRGALFVGQVIAWFFVGLSGAIVAAWAIIRSGKSPVT